MAWCCGIWEARLASPGPIRDVFFADFAALQKQIAHLFSLQNPVSFLIVPVLSLPWLFEMAARLLSQANP